MPHCAGGTDASRIALFMAERNGQMWCACRFRRLATGSRRMSEGAADSSGFPGVRGAAFFGGEFPPPGVGFSPPFGLRAGFIWRESGERVAEEVPEILRARFFIKPGRRGFCALQLPLAPFSNALRQWAWIAEKGGFYRGICLWKKQFPPLLSVKRHHALFHLLCGILMRTPMRIRGIGKWHSLA